MFQGKRKHELEESKMIYKPAAISVENVTASYGKTAALIGVSAMVEVGSIYALLGPSGCGKTTLLSCILARKKIDSGVVLVNNRSPGDRKSGVPGSLVGYMPQDICLYQEFTIRETFAYFGALQSMTKDEIRIRQEELIAMLELPEEDREVRQMSGGQKRRLSFSIALLHKPGILILDEPTVGVDPIVRTRVWDHLNTLCQSGVSTVITTHYVEEARQADRVGIMRQGRLLVQEEPRALMMRWEVDTLEEAFLILCRQQNWDSESQDDNKDALTALKSSSTLHKTRESKYMTFPKMPSFSNIQAMTIKNWIAMKRNLLMLFFIFLAPAILCIFDCVAVGQRTNNITVAMVNHESNCSEHIFDSKVCQPNLLGCHFLQALNGTGGFLVDQHSSLNMANIRAKSGEVRALFVIPENFSVSYLKRVLDSNLFHQFTYYFGISNVDEINQNETISISLDMSDPPMTGFIKEAIVMSLIRFQKDVSKLCGESYNVELDFSITNSPNAILGDESVDYREYITSAAVMLPIYFLAVARTAEAFISERSQGLVERSWIAGVLPFEILVSFILSQLLNVIIQVLIVVLTVFVGFGLPCRGNLFFYIILVIFQGFTGLCNGFFFSALCRTATDAIMLAVVNLFFSLFLCGIIWPVEMMPYPWLESVAWYLPHTAAVQGIRDITMRGWGIESASVQLGMSVSVGWSILFFACSWLLIKAKLQ
eukprot:GFUD01012917.1.p1 GENE.GFUD01012917.1~~GFUD01012917.1.p1  ORF type:complete len:711 (+),score=110.14 GFUD01012917.1:57-2189(+)